MKITCLHTAKPHVETFSQLFDSAEWEGGVDHMVRPDLLARAQDGDTGLAPDLRALIAGLQGDVILCSCSTLGPMAEASGDARFLRIDRPAMEAAARFDHVMLAICLPSTQEPSLALLRECGGDARVVLCAGAWPLFEAGDRNGFHRAVAAGIGRALVDAPQTDCILLGQASMQGAAVLLADTGIRVLVTPKMAVQRAIGIARR